MRDAVAASREAEDSTPGHRGAPPVVYASRTHSQLAQAMAELRRTAYAAETTAVALGSRAQLCCNPAVATLGSGAAANQACSAAVRSGSCGWHSRVDGFLRDNPGAQARRRRRPRRRRGHRPVPVLRLPRARTDGRRRLRALQLSGGSEVEGRAQAAGLEGRRRRL